MFKNGLLLNEENLKFISGGKTASQEHNPAGVAADPFAQTDTTIMQEGALSQSSAGGDNAHRDGLIGHEIIHAVNIQKHSEMYASDRQQFNLNSEYTGYRYQYNYALSIGDTVTANACQTEMTNISNNNQGVAIDWTYQL